ncbi:MULTISPECIES: hypothetical protein [Streptomyces violaceusniger group]|uniref:Secreted protein n=2 Tax=Streptomyces rhizosphaericus TaxID=114699 RepID=A0ABP3ZGE6_9ACTN|nr:MULTISPECIES: hypothetical protein [Streptomyces violaceusniger group]
MVSTWRWYLQYVVVPVVGSAAVIVGAIFGAELSHNTPTKPDCMAQITQAANLIDKHPELQPFVKGSPEVEKECHLSQVARRLKSHQPE